MAEHLHITPIGNDGIYCLDTASWRVFRPVMDKEKCVNCGMCLAYCPVNAIIGTEDKKFEITYDYCKVPTSVRKVQLKWFWKEARNNGKESRFNR